MRSDDLSWLPANGAHFTHDELERLMILLRALVDGTDDHEPNRAHAISIAYIVTIAADREGGNS